MKISVNWLNDYIDLSGLTATEIADKLTLGGLEVEEIQDNAKKYQGIVVGLVKECRKHPESDHLSVCLVSDGISDLQVVCGAPNVRQGQKVPFCRVGSFIPSDGTKIKKSKLRGVESFGMIASELELAISDSHEGIMVLDESIEEGTPISSVLGLDDASIEISITPNRPDALCHQGVARDLAAILKREVRIPEVSADICAGKAELSVEIMDDHACPRYTAILLEDLRVGESPSWLRQRLEAIGLRPINNVVDITNYVMYETGQPLHAFDFDKLKGNRIRVGLSQVEQKILTLDGKERFVRPEDLLISDELGPVAMAGIMGGASSEVGPETRVVLIESAYFNPSVIRKTSKLAGLSTDASYRFERGVNPDGTLHSALRAASMIKELAQAGRIYQPVDVYKKEIKPIEVGLRYSRIQKILGFPIPEKEILSILGYLGFENVSEFEGGIVVKIPLYRPDCEREIDLIEEIARIYGYDNVPELENVRIPVEAKVDQLEFTLKAKQTLCSMGFYETITNSLLDQESAAMFGSSIKVLSPQTIGMTDLRTSLLPGALQAVARNIRVKESDLMLFEVGHIFNKLTKGEISSFDDFTEEEHLLMTISGKAQNQSWNCPERPFDIYDLKGMEEEFFAKFSLDNNMEYSYHKVGDSIFEYSFVRSFKGKPLAKGGKLSSSVLKKFDIFQDVFVCDINMNLLKSLKIRAKGFSELLRYPKIVRDCAYILDKSIDTNDVINVIYKSSSKLLREVSLFDLFESSSLGSGKKSLAFKLSYFDESRTLTEEEVDKEFWKAIEKVKNTFNAELRGA